MYELFNIYIYIYYLICLSDMTQVRIDVWTIQYMLLMMFISYGHKLMSTFKCASINVHAVHDLHEYVYIYIYIYVTYYILHVILYVIQYYIYNYVYYIFILYITYYILHIIYYIMYIIKCAYDVVRDRRRRRLQVVRGLGLALLKIIW